MKVYVVTFSYCYGGSMYVSAVFATKTKANEYIRSQDKQKGCQTPIRKIWSIKERRVR